VTQEGNDPNHAFDHFPCPACGTPMPPGNEPGAHQVEEQLTNKCPGCGEEYPTGFLKDDFIEAVMERIHMEGRGELAPFLRGQGLMPATETPNGPPPLEARTMLTGPTVHGQLEPGDGVLSPLQPVTLMAQGGLKPDMDDPVARRSPTPDGTEVAGSGIPKPPVGPGLKHPAATQGPDSDLPPSNPVSAKARVTRQLHD